MSVNPDSLADRLSEILKAALQQDTIVDVRPSGVRDNLHVLVVSRELDAMTEHQKQEHLWGLLDDAVKNGSLTADELGRVSLVLPVSIDELRR